ncbi:hypothetical protein HMPREF9578_02040 [Cutibacterium acnes HL110PA4]|nr:hypothetical protein HMPREF9578_02040 [Cutibacterium acnes HL110PA4]
MAPVPAELIRFSTVSPEQESIVKVSIGLVAPWFGSQSVGESQVLVPVAVAV